MTQPQLLLLLSPGRSWLGGHWRRALGRGCGLSGDSALEKARGSGKVGSPLGSVLSHSKVLNTTLAPGMHRN